MSKPEFETVKLVANQCPEHKGGGYEIIGNYPDVNTDDSEHILVPANLENGISSNWDGPLLIGWWPYVLVKCEACHRVTVHFFSVNHKWKCVRQTWWRKHVHFEICGGFVSWVRLEKKPMPHLYLPDYTSAIKEKLPNLTEGELKDLPLYSMIALAKVDYDNYLSSMLQGYVFGKKLFIRRFMQNLTMLSNAGHVNRYIVAELEREHYAQEHLKQLADLMLRAAQQFYMNRNRGKQSIADKQMRLELARAAQELGLVVPPELLVDSSQKIVAAENSAAVGSGSMTGE